MIDPDTFEYEKELAIKMWEDIKETITAFYEDDTPPDYRVIEAEKESFCRKHNLHWRYNCWLCSLYNKEDHKQPLECDEACPLMFAYAGDSALGCTADDAPYEIVTDWTAGYGNRMAACDRIIEAIKEVTYDKSIRILSCL